METFQGSESRPGSGMEKALRFIMPIGLILGGIFAFNKLQPTIMEFLNGAINTTLGIIELGAIAVPLLFVVLYIVQNPALFYNKYLSLCRKITEAFIKSDPLSFMESHIEVLEEKRANLEKSKLIVSGQAVKLERRIADLTKSCNDGLKRAAAAKKIGNIAEATHIAEMAGDDKSSIEMFQPTLLRLNKNLEFLDKLDENWGYAIEGLKHRVDKLKTDFITNKETAKALGQAEGFATGGGEEEKLWQMSLTALEAQTSQYIANIDDFEKKSKNVMEGIDLDKQMMSDDGLALIEQYEKSGALFLPSKFDDVKAPIASTKPRQLVDKNSAATVDGEFKDLL